MAESFSLIRSENKKIKVHIQYAQHYEMLTGSAKEHHRIRKNIIKQLGEDVVEVTMSNDGVPESCEITVNGQLLFSMLESNWSKGFPDDDALAAALEQVKNGGPVVKFTDAKMSDQLRCCTASLIAVFCIFVAIAVLVCMKRANLLPEGFLDDQ